MVGQFPETPVHAEHVDLPGARVVGHRAAAEQDGRRGVEIGGELLAKEPRRHQRAVHATESFQRQVAQARADRIADDERAGEHGGADGRAEADGEQAAPAVAEAAKQKGRQVHRAGVARSA